jgi:hypothetical protein
MNTTLKLIITSSILFLCFIVCYGLHQVGYFYYKVDQRITEWDADCEIYTVKTILWHEGDKVSEKEYLTNEINDSIMNSQYKIMDSIGKITSKY